MCTAKTKSRGVGWWEVHWLKIPVFLSLPALVLPPRRLPLHSDRPFSEFWHTRSTKPPWGCPMPAHPRALSQSNSLFLEMSCDSLGLLSTLRKQLSNFFHKRTIRFLGHFTCSCAVWVTMNIKYSSNWWHLLTGLSWMSFLWFCVNNIFIDAHKLCQTSQEYQPFPKCSNNSHSSSLIGLSNNLRAYALLLFKCISPLLLHELLLLFDQKNVGTL